MQKRVVLRYYWMIIVISIAVAIGLNNLLLIVNLAQYSERYQKAVETLYAPPFLQQLLYTGILAPIFEELIFRGGVYKLLRKWIPFGWAMVVSAILFGVYHGNLVQFVYAGVCGLLLAYLYEAFGSLFAPILSHMVMNIVACTMTEFFAFSWIFQNMVRVVVITCICCIVFGIFFTHIHKMSKNWMLQKC